MPAILFWNHKVIINEKYYGYLVNHRKCYTVLHGIPEKKYKEK